MEAILDSVRRIISRWVETASPISTDVSPGDTIITVSSANRFRSGDEVMIEGPIEGEPNLIIEEVVDDTTIRLATPVFNSWPISEAPIIRKLVNGMFIQGIYIGDPEVIPQFPAITVNGRSLSSEWLTLDSTTEHFELEISIHVEESTHEDGYRFLLRIANVIREGLKRNIFPLVDDFNVTSILADIVVGDQFIKVADSSVFNTHLTDVNGPYPRKADARIILEDRFKSEETRVPLLIDETTIEIVPLACNEYSTEFNPIGISPQRFVYNSWPKDIQFGKTSKGALLQTAVINWFADEEVVQNLKKHDPHLK